MALNMNTNSNDSIDLTDVYQTMAVSGEQIVPQYTKMTSSFGMRNRDYEPRVVIIEQPQARGFRFRYECEGPSHGGLQGTNSERGRKTYPSIKIENYNKSARVEVSLVPAEGNQNHPHKLVGANCEDGICILDIAESTNFIQFKNMSVQHVTKRKAVEVLFKRITKKLIRDKKIQLGNLNAHVELSEKEESDAEKTAKDQAKSTQLNVVRLCFQVYIEDSSSGQCIIPLEPIYSQAIHDSKSPGASTLKICRMDKYGGCCTGNEEVFLLCEKVQKEDINVKFFELDKNGDTKWEGLGNFGPLDVHRQFAIVFRTPAYCNTKIEKAVHVFIVLERKSDGERSDPKSFTYYPQNLDKDEIKKKKRKKLPLDYGFSGYESYGGEGSSSNDGLGGTNDQYGSRSILHNGSGGIMKNSLPTTVLQLEERENDMFSVPATPVNLFPDMLLLNDPMYSNAFLETDSVPVETDETNSTNTMFYSMDSSSAYPKHNRQTALSCSRRDSQNTEIILDSFKTELSDSQIIQTELKSKKSEFELRETEQQLSLTTEQKHVPKKQQTQESSEEQTKASNESHTQSSSGSRASSKDQTPEVTQHQTSSNEPVFEAQTTKLKEGNLKAVENVNDSMKIIERTIIALQDYAETSDIRYLLIVQRHLASVQNTNGDLPIHLAVINEQLPALQCLLSVMATLPNIRYKVNCFNYLRQTPLHLAVLTKQPQIIELLLQYGSDPCLMDRTGNTPVNLAVQLNSLICLQSLLKYVRTDVNTDQPFPELNYMNYEGYCPAHIAAQNGNVDILRMLDFAKADLDLPDGKSGRTPLHHAVESDDLSIANYLLMEADADVNSQCFDGNTSLHIACGRNLIGMIALLVTADADINIENEESYDEGYDSENNDDANENNPKRKRGMKPADYVTDNEQILGVLGLLDKSTVISQPPQPPTQICDDIEEDGVNTNDTNVLKSVAESGLGSISSISGKGDLFKLSYGMRMKLSSLLDPLNNGKDVFALADQLGLGHFKNALEGIKTSNTSPTRFLLDYYETSDGTIEALMSSLKKMKRYDAISEIRI